MRRADARDVVLARWHWPRRPAAAAQEATDPEVATCGPMFVAMDNAARVNLLSRLAIGDEIDAADNDAAVRLCGGRRGALPGHAGPAGGRGGDGGSSGATSDPPGRPAGVKGFEDPLRIGTRIGIHRIGWPSSDPVLPAIGAAPVGDCNQFFFTSVIPG